MKDKLTLPISIFTQTYTLLIVYYAIIKDTCCTALWVAVSGDWDSLSNCKICLRPSSWGCHAIFIIADPDPDQQEPKVRGRLRRE